MDGQDPIDAYFMSYDGLYVKAIDAMICRLTSYEFSNSCPLGATTMLPVALSLLAMSLLITA